MSKQKNQEYVGMSGLFISFVRRFTVRLKKLLTNGFRSSFEFSEVRYELDNYVVVSQTVNFETKL